METNKPSADSGSAAKVAGKNMMAVFAYLWLLIILPFLTDAKHDPFVKFHLKQGLGLLIFEVVGWVAGFFLGFIPILGPLIYLVWWFASLALAIVGIVNVVHGKENELPFVGRYAKNFNF